MSKIGYCRVSTADQHPDAQEARLKEAGCERVYTDHGVSGKLASRPGWDRCLDQLREGDVLVVTKLDRIGRSVINLVDVVRLLAERGTDLLCLDQQIDTSSPSGKLVFHVFSALAEWEAAIIRERTLDGLSAARVRHGGRLPGRKPSLSPDKIRLARELYAQRAERGLSAQRIAEIVGTSRATLYRHVS